MIKIQGYITNIIFRNEENLYTVGVFETMDGEITAVGKLVSAEIGSHYELIGDMVFHDKYGEQFDIKTAQIVMPKTEEAIEKYLSSGIFPHIGKKTAKNIVKKFGDEALEIMESTPNRLKEIRGLGKVKIKAITEALNEHKYSRDAILFLQEAGFGTKQAMNIYNEYKDETINVILENPYKLIDDIPGVGFKIADRTALKNGFAKDSEERIIAGIKYILEYSSSQNGDVFIEKYVLLRECSKILEISVNLIERVMELSIINGELVQKQVNNKYVIYNEKLYMAEDLAATRLIQMELSDQAWSDIDFDKAFENSILDEEQRQAVFHAFNNKITVITGGPGTGKTMIVNTIVEVAENNGISFLLAAPTGRAAKRMEESSGKKASTIHRMLKYYVAEDGFQVFDYDSDNPLEADLIIIDEASMIDIDLLSRFVDAITSETSLILVGDVDQLPAVGPGNVLKDLISSGYARVIKLEKIYRQDEDSSIVINAHRINQGQMPIFKASKDFFFVPCFSFNNTSNTLLDLVNRRLPNFYKIDPIEDIQVLSIMKKGDLGTIELNKKLQNILNPDNNDEVIEYGEFTYKVGDKVMQQKNNYNLKYIDKDGNEDEGVFNGDMGRIIAINSEKIEMTVNFDDGKTSVYSRENISELMHSYAITVHKSQGSEFPTIVIPIFAGPYMLLTKNLIYTAVTRARDLVVLVGDIDALERMIKNDTISERNSSLDIRMKEKAELFRGVLWF